MAIDLFCYSSMKPEDSQKEIDLAKKSRPDTFIKDFSLSNASAASKFQISVAEEFGLTANSLFLVRVKNKEKIHKTTEVTSTLKEIFGNEKIIILWENEKLI